MTDRIDDFLRGRLAADALSEQELADADAIAQTVTETRTFLAQRAAPDVTAAVLAAIAREDGPAAAPPAGTARHLGERLWTPVLIRVRPAYALLAVAATIALAIWPLGQRGVPAPASGAAPVFVQFRLETDASSVQLAGSFTNWQDRHELRQTRPGLWTLTLPLTEGVHDYAFLIDGERWVADPYATEVSDGFGGSNSRLTLLLPNGTSPS